MENKKDERTAIEQAEEAAHDRQQSPAEPPKVGNADPGQENWSYAGADSTSINEIHITSLEEAQNEQEMGGEEADAWIETSASPQAEKAVEINNGMELVKKLSKGYNTLINLTGKNLVERAISLGKVLIRLKDLAKGSATPWGAWAEKNLPFLGKRNREKFMLLARREDCHRYSFLGVDRIEMLCSATKESESEDPIGDLLGKYQIAYDETSEEDLAEFKVLVNSALNKEKLEKENIQASWELTVNLTPTGVDFDKPFLKKLKDIQECGGNPQTHLEKLSLNRGRDDDEPDTGKRLQDFNTLSNRLIKTIDYLIDDEGQLEKLDKTTLASLLDKLQKLHLAANPAVEDQAA